MNQYPEDQHLRDKYLPQQILAGALAVTVLLPIIVWIVVMLVVEMAGL